MFVIHEGSKSKAELMVSGKGEHLWLKCVHVELSQSISRNEHFQEAIAVDVFDGGRTYSALGVEDGLVCVRPVLSIRVVVALKQVNVAIVVPGQDYHRLLSVNWMVNNYNDNDIDLFRHTTRITHEVLGLHSKQTQTRPKHKHVPNTNTSQF